MSDVVIVEAVRTPVGKRNGGLSTVHPADLLATVQKAAIERSGIDPAAVGQVVTGCVSQVGEQAFNIGRTAWLSAGLPLSVANTTVDTQCGSSQQATNLATALVGSGAVDSALAGGVEVMSRVPIGSSGRKDLGLGIPIPKSYFPQYEMTSQFEGAERIADKWGISRDDTDAFGLRSQENAATAWAEDRFGTQIVPVEAPDVDEEGKPTGSTHTVSARRGPARDEPREARRAEARRPRRTACHTAGSSSQISDGAAAVLMMTAERADAARTPAAGPHRRHLPGRRRPGADAHRADRRHPAAVRAHRSRRRRHRRRRDQRGVRLRGAGLAEGARLPRRADQPERRRHRPRPPARAAPARCSSPRPSTSWSAPAAATAWCRCAAVAAWAPARSSSGSRALASPEAPADIPSNRGGHLVPPRAWHWSPSPLCTAAACGVGEMRADREPHRRARRGSSGPWTATRSSSTSTVRRSRCG